MMPVLVVSLGLQREWFPTSLCYLKLVYSILSYLDPDKIDIVWQVFFPYLLTITMSGV